METDAIIDVLSRTVPASGLESVASGDGMPTIYVALEQLVHTCHALRDTPELRFAFLADLLPVDYFPREPRFEMVYLLASLGTAGFGETPKRLRVKVRVPGTNPTVPSVSSIWPAAGAWKNVSPVAGLVTGTVPPSRGATDSPSMRSFASGSRGVRLRASDMLECVPRHGQAAQALRA